MTQSYKINKYDLVSVRRRLSSSSSSDENSSSGIPSENGFMDGGFQMDPPTEYKKLNN